MKGGQYYCQQAAVRAPNRLLPVRGSAARIWRTLPRSCPTSQLTTSRLLPAERPIAMPELIRSVVSRVRVYFKDRRQAPRLRLRLLFSISVNRKARANGAAPSDRTLKGHTRDISASGLAMMLPQVHLEGHHLAAEGRELQVVLELPTGAMPLVVMPMRYEKLDESELGCNYLIGAKIVCIEDDDRNRFEDFISRGLKRSLLNPESAN